MAAQWTVQASAIHGRQRSNIGGSTPKLDFREISVRLFWGAAAAGAALLVATVAVSQTGTPAAAIQARQGQFREIGTAFKAINDELRKEAPGKFVLGSSARQIAMDLRQVRTLFPVGSGAAGGVKTKALPAIWAQRARFDALNAAATVEADKLVATLRGGGDQAAIAAQAKALGASCKSCHVPFRAPD